MLGTAGVSTNIYTPGAGRLLLTALTESLTPLKAFLLSQPEIDHVDIGTESFYPIGREAAFPSMDYCTRPEELFTDLCSLVVQLHAPPPSAWVLCARSSEYQDDGELA